jgi:hypothetical protein
MAPLPTMCVDPAAQEFEMIAELHDLFWFQIQKPRHYLRVPLACRRMSIHIAAFAFELFTAAKQLKDGIKSGRHVFDRRDAT